MFDVILAAALETATIPFSVTDNRMVVQARINGRGPYAMILDTGASGVSITPQTAEALGLRLSGGPRIGGAGADTVATWRAILDSISLASYRVPAHRALVINLDRIRKAFHFPRLDGIIGLDALQERFVEIDPDNSVVRLASEAPATPVNAARVPYRLVDGLMVVDGAFNGVHGAFVVDTGDRSALTAFGPFAQANDLLRVPLVQRNVVTGYGIGGPIWADVFTGTLDAFGTELTDVPTRAPIGPAGVFSDSRFAGSIGNAVLRKFVIVFDTEVKTLDVWRSREGAFVARTLQPQTLPRHGTFGALVVNADGRSGTLLKRVIAGGAAAAAQLQEGDIITALDGIATPDSGAFLSVLDRFGGSERVRVAGFRGTKPLMSAVVLGTPANEEDADVTTTYGSVAVDGSWRRTLLTTPKNGAARLPAVLIVGGIGCYSVDVAANAQDSYMRLSHDLSRAGYAVLRIEKSGVGDSEGPPCARVDMASEVRGYRAALQALMKDTRVDPARVYLFGHSIGTLEAPMLARELHVAGVIAAEGVGRDWPEYEVRNLRRQLELGGASAADVDAALMGKQTCLVRYLLQDESEAEIERTEPDCRVHNGVYPADAWYMRQVVHVPIAANWSKVRVPVLLIYGSSDFVTEREDHERVAAIVNGEHPGMATFVPIAGMDHLLGVAPTPKASLDAASSGAGDTYDVQLSAAVIAWLRQQQPNP